jgi:hypothetical protein
MNGGKCAPVTGGAGARVLLAVLFAAADVDGGVEACGVPLPWWVQDVTVTASATAASIVAARAPGAN